MRRANERRTSRSRSETSFPTPGCFISLISAATLTLIRSDQRLSGCLEQAARLERLDDKLLCPGRHRLRHERLLRDSAAHQDIGLLVEIPDLAERSNAAQVAHENVHRDDVGAQQFVLLNGLDAGRRLADDLEPTALKNGAHESPHV